MKKLSIINALILIPLLASAKPFEAELEPGSKQSVVYVGSYDWGACIEKIVVNAGRLVSPQAVRAKDFDVNQILYPKSTNMGMIKGGLSVTDAFASDAKGNKVTAPSQYITILTDVYPEAENASPFVSISFGGRFQNYYGYKIKNSELNLSVTEVKGFVNEAVARFEASSFDYIVPASEEEKANPNYEETKITLPYMAYIPPAEQTEQAEQSSKIPLILWFPGMGESGTNPYLVLFGTKASALSGEKIQSHFENGAAVLAPQCPTGWLETTEKSFMGARYWAPIDKDSVIGKVKRPFTRLFDRFFVLGSETKEERIPFAAVSYYTEPIKKLLYTFLAEHPEIDRSRVYVGGCSVGGYMTMNMMIQSPELFAAAFPVCEYYLDSKITDSQLKMLAMKPFWFTYALNDESVNPEKNAIATIKRLREAGAENLHVSEFRTVVDLSGRYLKKRNAKPNDSEYGLPYEYDGHESWIYVLNDACADGELSLFSWLSEQKIVR